MARLARNPSEYLVEVDPCPTAIPVRERAMPETSHALNFRKSSYSGSTTQNCVEVADTGTGAAVRDTQNRQAGHLAFTSQEWAALLTTVRP